MLKRRRMLQGKLALLKESRSLVSEFATAGRVTLNNKAFHAT